MTSTSSVPRQVVRDHERAQGVVGDDAARVPDDVRIAFLEPEELGGIEPRVHAGDDREFAGGRRRQGALVEVTRVLLVRGQDLVADQGRHSASFISDSTITSVAKVTDLRSRMGPVVDAAQAATVDVAVDLGRRERAVPEQLLDHAEVGTALQQVGRERVPQPVRVGRQPA